MTFLYPAFLLGAIAIAIPIVLHLMRRDVAPEVPFTAVRLLRRSPIQRSKRRRLRDLAAPRRTCRRAAPACGGVCAAVRAIGASLGHACHRRRSLLQHERAGSVRKGARACARRDRSRVVGERVAVVAFDERAQLIAEPGTRADARGALAGLSPSFAGTHYAPLVRKAIEVAEGGRGTLVVVSDLQRSGWENVQPIALPPGWNVESLDIGEARGNLSITALTVEPDRVVSTVRNGWGARKTGRIRIRHDDREIASAAYDVPPSSSLEVPVVMRTPAAGGIAASLEDPEGLSADDTRYRALGSGAQPRVLIVSVRGAAAGSISRVRSKPPLRRRAGSLSTGRRGLLFRSCRPRDCLIRR